MSKIMKKLLILSQYGEVVLVNNTTPLNIKAGILFNSSSVEAGNKGLNTLTPNTILFNDFKKNTQLVIFDPNTKATQFIIPNLGRYNRVELTSENSLRIGEVFSNPYFPIYLRDAADKTIFQVKGTESGIELLPVTDPNIEYINLFLRNPTNKLRYRVKLKNRQLELISLERGH